MIPQASCITFYRVSLLLLCGLLALQWGCAHVGETRGSDHANVTGGSACVGLCAHIPPETTKELKDYGVSEAALANFFKILDQNQVPVNELDHELRKIAKDYLDLKTKAAQLSSDDPEVRELIQKARSALEAAQLDLAERLFNEASQRDEEAAQELEQVATVRRTSAAATQAANGDLQTVQLNFVKAQSYYQKALELLPPSDREHRGQYLNSLGISLQEAGIRTKGGDIQKLLHESVDAYREALTVYTKDALPQQWAMTQNNLGIVLRDQGTRTGGEAGTKLLAEAVAAYRAALEIRTREHLPEGWAQTHNNLAKAALSLEDWPTAAESSRNVLTLYPDYDEAYQRANGVYHDKLFAYQSAFEISKQWLDRHPEDVPGQANFAEAHLTTGRYGEAERRLEALLKKPELDPSSKVGLRIVEIVTALALKKSAAVPQKLEELRAFVSTQPDSFHADWSFDGTAHYVQTEQVFAPYRPWLMDLFAVVKVTDRASFLAALDRVQAGFRP